MPRRKEQFITGEIYHIIVRAIDNNLIFKDTDDYFRGIFSIYEFNNLKSVSIKLRRRARRQFKFKKLVQARGLDSSVVADDEREKIVEVLAFCFMPNHIHLLLRQTKGGGISKFMQKVGGGYGRYFNDKYKRKGHVFQNQFKSVYIKDNNQFMVVVSYIFTNPVALIEPNWKERGIRNHSAKEVIKFLEEYKWSSYQDCTGIKNFTFVTTRDFLLEVMGGEQGVKKVVKDWIEQKKDIAKYAELFLE